MIFTILRRSLLKRKQVNLIHVDRIGLFVSCGLISTDSTTGISFSLRLVQR